jgi:hypothetical protein
MAQQQMTTVNAASRLRNIPIDAVPRVRSPILTEDSGQQKAANDVKYEYLPFAVHRFQHEFTTQGFGRRSLRHQETFPLTELPDF